jgi:TetR/AcrR family transcriptional regulator, regulator of cefoperazone and chloramphenicol sensitivity
MSDDTADRVINAAGPIFARLGFDGATVREICESAGVNVASVNYHFGDKATLYLEAVKRAHEQKSLRVPLPEADPDMTREERLFGFVHTILQRLLGGGGEDWHTALLMREMIQPTHACKPLVEDFIRPQFHRLLEVIDEFIEREITPLQRHQLAFSVVGQCLQYRVAAGFVSLLTDPQERPRLLDIDTLAQAITRFSVAALSHWAEQPAVTERPRANRSLRSPVGTPQS